MARRRGKATRRQRRKQWIYCVGKLTEPLYYNGLRSLERLESVEVKGFDLSPDRLLERIASDKRRQQETSAAARQDSYWLVSDKDNFRNLASLRTKAARLGVEVILSNPCFEVWLLLHFEVYTASQDANGVQRRLADTDHYYVRKNINFLETYAPRVTAAIANTEGLKNFLAETDSAAPDTDNATLIKFLLDK